jgi:hypothetical protein
MRITIALSALLALAAAGARADTRAFIRAYEYATQPKGNLEVELWNDVAAPQSGVADSVITHRIELEYGITDHWDMALYHVFEHGGPQTDPEPFHFDSWRLETRYRLSDKGVWPVDVMLYLEAERPADLSEPFEMEEKIILEKDFGRLGVVLNLVAEQHVLRADLGRTFEFDLGAKYEVMPALRVAAEVWSTHEFVGPNTNSNYYFGPSMTVATQRIWLQLGAGFGLDTNQAQKMFIRSVLGFNI